jgi:integrase
MGVKVRQKDGKWYVFINHQGKRKAKCVGDSKKAAEEVKRKLEAKLTLGEFSLDEARSSAPIFDEYAERWLATYAKHNCKESTYARYAGVVRKHLRPAFGAKPLTEITRDDIKGLIYQKRETADLSPSSIRQILAPLREMLNHAVEDSLMTNNPASRVGRFIQQPQELGEQINPLTREELALFFDTIRVRAPEHYPFFLCLARTGMRLGEALALQWGDIDWHGRFIEVRRNYVCGKITRPKNGKSRRVDMSQQLAEALHQLLTQRKTEKLQGKWVDLPEWVFCSQVGRQLHSNNLRRRVFYPCLEKAGLRRVRIHDLRHTYASLLIQNGESLAYIRDQLGHHSIQVTVDIYGHLVPGGNQAAVDRLDDAPNRNLSATSSKGPSA